MTYKYWFRHYLIWRCHVVRSILVSRPNIMLYFNITQNYLKQINVLWPCRTLHLMMLYYNQINEQDFDMDLICIYFISLWYLWNNTLYGPVYDKLMIKTKLNTFSPLQGNIHDMLMIYHYDDVMYSQHKLIISIFVVNAKPTTSFIQLSLSDIENEQHQTTFRDLEPIIPMWFPTQKSD